MRLFIALDIDDAIRERIARFVEGVRNFAPDARWVKPESLHVTLKFIGEQPDAAVDQIKQALSASRSRADQKSTSAATDSSPPQNPLASSGSAWKPARNSQPWPPPSTTKWHPSEFRKKTAPSVRT